MKGLARLVVATDNFPLRPVYAGIYRASVELLKALARPLKGLCGVYLTGSYVQGNHVHGRSDIDFFLVVDRTHEPGAVKSVLERCAAVFPFLGPVEERLNQVVTIDELKLVDNPYLLYRQRAGLLYPLYERPGFELAGIVPNAALWLAEACLQIRLAVEGIQKGTDDLYFWRSRLDALKRIVKLSDGKWKEPLLALQGSSASLVGRMDGREKCLEAMKDLLKSLDGFDGIHYLRPANVSGWEYPPHLDEVTHETLSKPGPWTAHIGGFVISQADPRWVPFRRDGALFSWFPLCLTGFAEPIIVMSRLEIHGQLWDWTREQGRRTLAWLPHALEDRRLLESDWGLMQVVFATLSLRAPHAVTGRADLMGFLKHRFPTHEPFLNHMERYMRGLEDGQGLTASRGLPPNFFGYLLRFVRAQLGLGPYPRPSSLDRRLTLSLCVVTRDRAHWLSELLATVALQTRPPDEIVVVDNSPKASAREVCESFRVRYVHQPEGRLGALRNRAVEESTGEIVAFTDDDCLLEPHWLEHVERSFLRDERIGAVGGRVRHYRERETAVDRFHQAYLG